MLPKIQKLVRHRLIFTWLMRTWSILFLVQAGLAVYFKRLPVGLVGPITGLMLTPSNCNVLWLAVTGLLFVTKRFATLFVPTWFLPRGWTTMTEQEALDARYNALVEQLVSSVVAAAGLTLPPMFGVFDAYARRVVTLRCLLLLLNIIVPIDAALHTLSLVVSRAAMPDSRPDYVLDFIPSIAAKCLFLASIGLAAPGTCNDLSIAVTLLLEQDAALDATPIHPTSWFDNRSSTGVAFYLTYPRPSHTGTVESTSLFLGISADALRQLCASGSFDYTQQAPMQINQPIPFPPEFENGVLLCNSLNYACLFSTEHRVNPGFSFWYMLEVRLYSTSRSKETRDAFHIEDDRCCEVWVPGLDDVLVWDLHTYVTVPGKHPRPRMARALAARGRWATPTPQALANAGEEPQPNNND